MRTAIVYYSLTGNAARIAGVLSGLLDSELIELKPVKAYPDKGFKKFLVGGKDAVSGAEPELLPYSFEAEGFEAVIFITPVWASRMAPPLRTFISENREALKGKKLGAAVTCRGGGADKALEDMRAHLDILSFQKTAVLLDPHEKNESVNDRQIAGLAASFV